MFADVGRFVRDPELKEFDTSTLATFAIAIAGYGDKTTFLDCKCWGKRANVIEQYFAKGDMIFVAGNIEQENWEAKDGTKRSKLVLNVFDFKFVTSKKEKDERNYEQGEKEAVKDEDYSFEDDDDVPF